MEENLFRHVLEGIERENRERRGAKEELFCLMRETLLHVHERSEIGAREKESTQKRRTDNTQIYDFKLCILHEYLA